MKTKEEKFQAIIATAFVLVEQRGIKGISISLLSQRSKISRGWIYKYVAKDIDGVLRFCLKAYAEEFARFTELVSCTTKEELKSSILSFTEGMINKVLESQSILSIYFGHILTDNLIGEVVRETDQRYLNHIAQNFETVFKDDRLIAMTNAEIFHSMRMGGLLLFLKNKEQDLAFLKIKFLKKLECLLDSF
jgi:AcrR family transcriptional regulator